MKKFTIQNITIIVNNKEKVNIICLECKDDKYVLYTEKNIIEENINNNTFIKFQFNENLNITPKKKLTDLFFSINSNNNLYSLLWNNNPVYFLKNSKNIQINDINLKLILSNGVLFNNIKEISLNLDVNKKEKNIIDDILHKNKKMNDSIIKKYDTINKIKDVVEKNNIETDINVKEIIETEFNIKEIIETDINVKEIIETEFNIKEIIETDIINKEVIVNNIETEIINKEVIINNTETDINVKEVIVNNIETEIINKKVNGEKIDTVSESTDKDIIDLVKNINFTTTISNNNIEIKKIDNTTDTNDNLEKIKTITNIINEEKIDLDNKKIEIENNIFNLENVLLDFNKLFKSNDENKNINKDKNIDKNNINNINNIKITKVSNNINLNMNNENNSNKKIKLTNLEVKNNGYIHKQYITKIQYLNIFYKLNTIKIDKSNELNFLNLYQSKIIDNNIINNLNISFELENVNSSYLIIYFNQKYLINKVNNTIILTNLFNKKTQIIKNKDNFKLGMYDYMLYNDATLIIPMNNKKIYDNNYGTSFNMYIPKI